MELCNQNPSIISHNLRPVQTIKFIAHHIATKVVLFVGPVLSRIGWVMMSPMMGLPLGWVGRMERGVVMVVVMEGLLNLEGQLWG